MSRADRNADLVRQASAMLGKVLGGEETDIGRALLRGGGITPEMSSAIKARLNAAKKTSLGDAVEEAGGITMGQRSIPTMRDLGAAPVPEFPVPAGSPQIRRLQQLRQEIGAPQGPRESTAADYIYQPAIRGMQYPAGSVAEGSMFSAKGKYTPPGTRIGGRQMGGDYPYSPMPQVDPPTTARMPEGQMEIDLRSNEQLLGDTAPMTSPPIPNAQGNLVRTADGRLVRSPGGEVAPYQAPPSRQSPEVEFEDPMRPQGVRMVDLNTEFTMDPVQRRNAGLLGAGSLLIGTGAMLRRPEANNPAPEPLVPPQVAPMGDTPESPVGPTPGELPATGLQGEVETVIRPGLTPVESRAIEEQTSAALSQLQQSDPASSAAIRALAPRDPSSYKNIGEYYADQRRFVEAMDTGRMRDIVTSIGASQKNEAAANNMETWARSNPLLAYQLATRQGMINPAQNQQTGQSLTTSTVGSSLGDNNEANAIGQANAAASQINTVQASNELEAANLRQRNNEMIDAARPIVRPRLSSYESFLQNYGNR